MLTVIIITIFCILYYLYLWKPRPISDSLIAKPVYLGHRGAKHRAPENTVAAFLEVKKAGLHGTELDVVKTKDGRLVCSHNFDLEMETDGKGYIHNILYKDLLSVNAGINFQIPTKEQIPLLQDILALFPEPYLINIEIKTRTFFNISTVFQVARLVRRLGLHQRVIVSSFNPLILPGIKLIDRQIMTGFIIEPKTQGLIRFVNLIHPDYLHLESTLVTDDLLRYARQKGMAVNVWTVNNKPAIEWLVNKGVDGIITDRPEYCPLG